MTAQQGTETAPQGSERAQQSPETVRPVDGDADADAAGWAVRHGNPSRAELDALAAAFDRLAARAHAAAAAGAPRRADWSAAPYAAAGSWAR